MVHETSSQTRRMRSVVEVIKSSVTTDLVATVLALGVCMFACMYVCMLVCMCFSIFVRFKFGFPRIKCKYYFYK